MPYKSSLPAEYLGGREARLEALDVACKVAGELRSYTKFGQAKDGSYYINVEGDEAGVQNIVFGPESSVMNQVIGSAVA